MKKKKNPLVLIIIVVVVIAVIVYIYGEYKAVKTLSGNTIDSPGGSSIQSPPTVPITEDTILSKGDKNLMVRRLQEHYNKYVVKPPMLPLVVDGAYGSKTEMAVYNAIGQTATSLKYFKTKTNPLITGGFMTQYGI